MDRFQYNLEGMCLWSPSSKVVQAIMIRQKIYSNHFLSFVHASIPPCVHPLTFLNDFSSEAPEPILLKFHMEHT